MLFLLFFTYHYAKGRPRLPHHYHPPTNLCRSTFGRIDRDSGGFGSDTDSEEESSDEKVPPCIGNCTPYACDEREEGCDPNGPSSDVNLMGLSECLVELTDRATD